MQFKKIAATAGSALMAGLALAGPALAAVDTVADIPNLVSVEDGVVTFPSIVVGATAATADVAGAINVGVKLAAEAGETKELPGTAATFSGIVRDGVNICDTTTTANCDLDNSITGGSAFPSGNVLKNTHYSGLKDSTISWKSTDYNYREDVDVSGVRIRHALGVNNINGTLKMVVETGDKIIYKYIFENAINLSKATTAGSTGTIANPEYSTPIKIKIMDTDFTIVGVGATSIKMLIGETGRASPTTPVSFTAADGVEYSVYGLDGKDGTWTEVKVVDGEGNQVGTTQNINDGSDKTFDSKVTVKVITSYVGANNVYSGSDIVIGEVGQVEHEYDGTADVDSTGSANEAFPGTTRWGIYYTATSGSNGNIPANAEIRVVYKPKDIQYLIAGENIELPNNYGELGFVGYNTDSFATITIEPTTSSVAIYNSTSTSSLAGFTMYGLKISSDQTGVIKAGGSFYTTSYLLWNATVADGYQPIAVGHTQNDGKVRVNDRFNRTLTGAVTAISRGGLSNNTEYGFAQYSGTGDRLWNYTFVINAAEKDFFLSFEISNATTLLHNSGWGQLVNATFDGGVGPRHLSGKPSINMSWNNLTQVGGTSSQLSSQLFRLGETQTTSEAREVGVVTEASAITNAGTKSQDIVTDSGLVLVAPSTNGALDKVVVKVPGKALAGKIYFGKQLEATEGATYKEPIAVTSDIGALDTETTAATAGDLILVGGPCVNTLVADLAADGKFPYDCEDWPAENFALVKVVQDAFSTGQVAVVIAGTRATDTDTATSAVQQDLLTADHGATAKITDLTATGITAFTGASDDSDDEE